MRSRHRVPSVLSVLWVLSISALAEPIDLPTVLKLAGANAVDVQIAEQVHAEARAIEQQRVLAFIPTVSVGAGYRGHSGQLQDVVGDILDVDKQSYTLGGTVAMDVNFGDAWFKRLAAKQQTQAAAKQVDSQRLATQTRAAIAYFELVRAQAAVAVAEEAVRISQDYGKQVGAAVKAGVTFKGDALRVDVQTRRNQVELEKAKGAQRQAGVQLAAILRLPPEVALQAADREPALMSAVNGDVKALTAQALVQRPEVAAHLAQIAAAQHDLDAAKKGPWVPTLTAQVFAGGLDGGIGGSTRGMRDSEDYIVGLSWKIGAGGLFDRGRQRAAEARVKQAELREAGTKEAIIAQVVGAHVRTQSLKQQVSAAREAVKAAEENNKLTHERQEFAVGVVLETVLAEQELTRARQDYLNAITAHNAAQFALRQAIGSTK
jgi:outer membrane protein TolC